MQSAKTHKCRRGKGTKSLQYSILLLRVAEPLNYYYKIAVLYFIKDISYDTKRSKILWWNELFECHTRLSHQVSLDIFLPPLLPPRYFFFSSSARSIFFFEFYLPPPPPSPIKNQMVRPLSYKNHKHST